MKARHPLALFAVVCLQGLAADSRPAAPASPVTPLPVVGEMRTYKQVSNRELKLFVVKPDGWKKTEQRPALVFFHGGGWVGGTPSQFNDQAAYLAKRGMVCILVEYRLLENSVDLPRKASPCPSRMFSR